MTADDRLAAALRATDGLTGHALFDALADRVCDADLARQWLREWLAMVAGGGTSLPAGRADAVMQSLVLLDDGRAQLSLALVGARDWHRQRISQPDAPDVIGFADGWTRIVFLSADGAAVQRFVFDGRTAHAQSVEGIATGQVLDLANDRESLRFSDLGGDVVMLRLLVRDPGLGLAMECDAATGAVLRTRQAQSHEGRSQMIVSLLRSLGRQDAVSVIAERINGWPPHLRWHGVREALATDSIAGFRLLTQMAEADADAGLRALAARTRSDLALRYPDLAEPA